jgi:Endodeoxyribonuclease RusA
VRTGVAFVRAGRPPTANKNAGVRRIRFDEEMRAAYRRAGGLFSEQPCYGLVYYIKRGYDPARDADADNIAKPVWDALEGAAYPDDRAVKLRVAGLIEAGETPDGSPTMVDLDLTEVPKATADELFSLLFDRGEEHVLYIEIGPIERGMFRSWLSGAGYRR